MILKEWLSQYEKLELIETKELCKIALEINADIERKECLEKVVLGILYVVYEYINRNE